jgi:hypothetical protein
MAKNLLKQIMIKDTKKKNRNSEEDESLVEGLDTAINAGYLTKTKPKFTKKTNFSASNLTYGSGECPRYWSLAFDGQIFYDNSDAIGVANRTQ